MNWLRLFRQSDNATRRIPARRRPLVEALEGRQLLSGIVGNHIGAMIQGSRHHIGLHAMIQGNHIGYRHDSGQPHRLPRLIPGQPTSAPPMIVGSHIGTNVV